MRIYYAKTDAIANETAFERALQLLPQKRLEKLSRIKLADSRIQCVAAGLLLEYGLQEFGISGKNVTFLENEDGKPYIQEYPKLYYNLSHSGDYVALVIGEGSVGVDIEKQRNGQSRLVQRFFAKDEVEWLTLNWSDEAFTRMWTRKEAYLKAKGIGMRMPLAGFSVLGSCVSVNDEMPLEMQETDVMYYLQSYPINDEYWLSVCQKERKVLERPVEVKIGV